jgi:hypothetical protein
VSRSVDLFVSSEEPIEVLAALITARTGLTPVDAPSSDVPFPDPSGSVLLTDGRLTADLHEHRFIDDGDLVLGPYRYALSLRTTVGGHLGVSPETELLRRVAARLDDHPVLLVLDLQYRAGAGAAPSGEV